MNITVIGESNIDIIVKPCCTDGFTVSSGGCRPSRIRFHHGGVARNIAHNLCLLGHDVRLMTVFGGDDFAARLIDDCECIGMDVSLSTRFEGEQSPIFLSFNNSEGEMQSAFSDVGLNRHMDLDWLKGKMPSINRTELVVADTLLSVEALAHLIDHCAVPLFVDTVSPPKAKRFAEALSLSERHGIHALKCNLAEAQAITKETDAIEAAKQLNDRGVSQVYLTIGSSGVIHCAKGVAKSFPALSATVQNTTGSGDAFFAGIIHAHTLGHFAEHAIPIGLEMAKRNLEAEEVVSGIKKNSETT